VRLASGETLSEYVRRTRNDDGSVKGGQFFGMQPDASTDQQAEQLIECVPNFSEGRDLGVIKQITDLAKTGG